MAQLGSSVARLKPYVLSPSEKVNSIGVNQKMEPGGIGVFLCLCGGESK